MCALAPRFVVFDYKARLSWTRPEAWRVVPSGSQFDGSVARGTIPMAKNCFGTKAGFSSQALFAYPMETSSHSAALFAFAALTPEKAFFRPEAVPNEKDPQCSILRFEFVVREDAVVHVSVRTALLPHACSEALDAISLHLQRKRKCDKWIHAVLHEAIDDTCGLIGCAAMIRDFFEWKKRYVRGMRTKARRQELRGAVSSGSAVALGEEALDTFQNAVTRAYASYLRALEMIRVAIGACAVSEERQGAFRRAWNALPLLPFLDDHCGALQIS